MTLIGVCGGKYRVCNTGRVLSVRRDKWLKPWRQSKGYRGLDLDGCKYLLHRLVAEAFLPNPLRLPQVNHIDGDKSNNAVDNLEWISCLDNIRHAFRIGLYGKARKKRC